MPEQLMGVLAVGTFYLVLIILGLCATRCLTDEDEERDGDKEEEDEGGGSEDALDLLRLLETSLTSGPSRDTTQVNLSSAHNRSAPALNNESSLELANPPQPLDILTNHILPGSDVDVNVRPSIGALGKSRSVDVGTSTENIHGEVDVLDTTVQTDTPPMVHRAVRHRGGTPPFPISNSMPANISSEQHDHMFHQRHGEPPSVRGIRPLGSPASYSSDSSTKPPVPLAGRHFLADRNIGWIMGTLSMLAIKTGGIAPNAIVQEIYEQGFLWCHIPIASALSLIVGGTLFSRAMYSDGYVTIIDPFQCVYGARVGAFLFVPVLIADVFMATVVISNLGSIQSDLLDLSSPLCALGSVCTMLCYLCVGGFYATTFTDGIQFGLIIMGLLMMLPVHLMSVSHSPTVFSSEAEWLGDLNGRNSGLYIDQMVMLILGGVPMQSYFQRIFSSKSSSTATKITWLSSFGCLLAAVPTMLIGLSVNVADWTNTTLVTPPVGENSTKIFEMTLTHLVPGSFQMLILGALVSGLLATGDSAIFGLSTMFTQNIYRNCFKIKAEAKDLVLVSQISTVAFSVLSLLLCLVWSDWHLYWMLPYDILYVFVFPQLFCVIYFKYSNTYGAVAGFWVALLFRLLLGESLIDFGALLKLPFYSRSEGQLFPYRTLAMLANLLTIICVSLLVHFLYKADIMPSEQNICREQIDFNKFVKSSNGRRQRRQLQQNAGSDSEPITQTTQFETRTARGYRQASRGPSQHPQDLDASNNVPLTITSIYRHGNDRMRRQSPLVERMTVL